MEDWAGGGGNFWSGRYRPVRRLSSRCWGRAPTALSRGGRDLRVVATSSIPQGIRSLHHGRGCRVVASSYCFPHGRGKANKKHGQEKIVVRGNTGWKMLF
jgi:hypothetical protein